MLGNAKQAVQPKLTSSYGTAGYKATMLMYRWPAVVTPDPWSEGAVSHMCEEREGCIYHVEFLGRDHTHSWLVEDKVLPPHTHKQSQW